jgi:hypothetical protein
MSMLWLFVSNIFIDIVWLQNTDGICKKACLIETAKASSAFSLKPLNLLFGLMETVEAAFGGVSSKPRNPRMSTKYIKYLDE